MKFGELTVDIVTDGIVQVDPGGPFGLVHTAIRQYEWGRWEEFSESAAALDLDENAMPAVFAEAVRWADSALSSM